MVTAFWEGNNMINGQFLQGKALSTVLAGLLVSFKNLLATRIIFNQKERPYVLAQSNDAGEFKTWSGTVNMNIMKLNDVYAVLQPKDNGLFPINNFDWFVPRIKNQGTFKVWIESLPTLLKALDKIQIYDLSLCGLRPILWLSSLMLHIGQTTLGYTYFYFLLTSKEKSRIATTFV